MAGAIGSDVDTLDQRGQQGALARRGQLRPAVADFRSSRAELYPQVCLGSDALLQPLSLGGEKILVARAIEAGYLCDSVAFALLPGKPENGMRKY